MTPALTQGLFLAPTVVKGALKGAVFAANIYEKLGFKVIPDSKESRHDIIQEVEFHDPELMVAFCEGIQAAAPVDSFVQMCIRDSMNSIYDLERLTMKVSYRTANPRDLISFKTSIQYLPYIKDILAQFSKGVLAKMAESLDTLEDLHELLESSIEEDPPIPIKEGGIIKEGFDEEIDHLKKAKTDGKTWLAELEEREREKTGIKNLRVRFNKVFGYYIEVTNSYKDLVPDYYIRRQTLANAERYTTEELSELARTILGAEDKLYALEYETYVAIREKLASEMERIQKTASVIAWTDVFASLALVAEANQYVRPTLNQRGVIDIKDGRHPVVERCV